MAFPFGHEFQAFVKNALFVLISFANRSFHFVVETS